MDKFEIQEPMNVANYIIERAKERKKPISNLHLQKVLYFLQAAFLVEYGEPIINGEFSRWSYGPVLKKVYVSYKDNGSSSIEDLAPNISIDHNGWNILPPQNIKKEEFDEDSMSLLNNTIDTLLNESPWKLVERTHNQSLWSEYEADIREHQAKDYTNSEILNYFKSNKGEQIWK